MIAHMHNFHRLRQMLTGAQTLNYTNSKHPNTVSQHWFNYFYKLQEYLYNTALSSELIYINDDQLTDDKERKKNIKDKFNVYGSVHHWSILIIVQWDATHSSLFIILQVHCTCFGCQPHPSSGVHETVTTASGNGHIFCAAASLQRGQAS